VAISQPDVSPPASEGFPDYTGRPPWNLYDNLSRSRPVATLGCVISPNNHAQDEKKPLERG